MYRTTNVPGNLIHDVTAVTYRPNICSIEGCAFMSVSDHRDQRCNSMNRAACKQKHPHILASILGPTGLEHQTPLPNFVGRSYATLRHTVAFLRTTGAYLSEGRVRDCNVPSLLQFGK